MIALRAIARELGADVAFFLEGGTVLGVDRGDVLFPLIDRPPAWVVLAVPNFGVSTRDAYRWWDERAAGTTTGEPRAGNDLQAPVAARHPEISRAVARLRGGGALTRRCRAADRPCLACSTTAQSADAAPRPTSRRVGRRPRRTHDCDAHASTRRQSPDA